jgi:NAD(P)H-flavin reductase
MYKIVNKTELALKIKLFEVEAPDVAAKAQAGQFLIVIHGKAGERVPLTICGYDAKKVLFLLPFTKLVKQPSVLVV